MHIVSGSDENELQFLAVALGLKEYFVSIHGSPVPKKDLVDKILTTYRYDPFEIVFIGDSINDLEAASAHNIDFVGYNNPVLANLGVGYIQSYHTIQV
jgi:phosphoglycolate phosphatase-like HAD superfamily hydrolase